MVCVKEMIEEASIVEGDGGVGVTHSLPWWLVSWKEVGDDCCKDGFAVKDKDCRSVEGGLH